MTDLFTKQFTLFSEDAKKEKLMEQEKGKLDDIYGKTFAADSIHKRADSFAIFYCFLNDKGKYVNIHFL